jgi:hypothetical protein
MELSVFKVNADGGRVSGSESRAVTWTAVVLYRFSAFDVGNKPAKTVTNRHH